MSSLENKIKPSHVQIFFSNKSEITSEGIDLLKETWVTVHLRTFALIVSAHPNWARNSLCGVMPHHALGTLSVTFENPATEPKIRISFYLPKRTLLVNYFQK